MVRGIERKDHTLYNDKGRSQTQGRPEEGTMGWCLRGSVRVLVCPDRMHRFRTSGGQKLREQQANLGLSGKTERHSSNGLFIRTTWVI